MDLTATVDKYGGALLEYICATESGTFPKTIEEVLLKGEKQPRLDPRQQEVLDLLDEIPPPKGEPRIVVPSSLVVTVDSESGHTSANLLRLRAGGRLPDVSDADPVLSPLLAIAVEGFPSLLLTNGQLMMRPESSRSFGIFPSSLVDDLGTVFDRHPRKRETLEAIAADQALSALFGRQVANLPQDPSSVAISMLKGAALSLLVGSEDLTAEAFLTQIRLQVDGARRLGLGQSVDGTLLVGITGFALGDEMDNLELPWGTVTSPRARFRMIGGTGLNQGEPATALLQFRIEFGPGGPDRNPHAEAQSAMRPLALATLMAEGRAGLPTPLTTWTTVLGPLGDGRSFIRPMPPRFPQSYPTPLDPPRVETLRQWCSLVEETDPAALERIAIAIDRLISAVSEHGDTARALLDAVMVWENLFGSKQETGFKIAAALTILILDDPRDRPEMLKKIRATYDVRSDLVHAARTLEPAAIAVHRDRAIDLGLNALRVLIHHRPDLLERTSSKRAEAILLNLPPEN